MAPQNGGFVRVASVDEVRRDGAKLVTVDGQAIGVFHHEGEIYALDNRCPHMGFPLTRGTVEDGILTCHWHHARFELSCGSTFDPFADDVPSYPVRIRDGEVWVRPEPTHDRPPRDRWAARLEDGLEENLGLVMAKSVVGLLDADVDPGVALRIASSFGVRYRDDGWGSGMTILSAMANLLDDLEPDDRARALFVGVRSVAADCAGEPPRFVQEPFESRDIPSTRLRDWFRECVEVRDTDGAERVLRTAIAGDLPQSELASIMLAAGTDHRFLDTGHTLDFMNKAFELLDRVGWQEADRILPAVIPAFTDASRSEERSSWRKPVDLVVLLDEAFEALPERIAAGESAGPWTAPDGFRSTILSDDAAAIVDAVLDAISSGATSTDLAGEVVDAAAVRIAQFSTANEFRDWNTVHHTYTYANAVHRLSAVADERSAMKAILDGAINVYLDRFLNIPPVPIPDPDGTDSEPAALLERLLDSFDEEGADGVRTAGRLVAEYLAAGGEAGPLQRTLGHALLREDANFHTLQNVEAAFRQFKRHDDPVRGRIHLVATARYLAAHVPTRREREQTFTIANRLHRGERLHEGAE